MDICADTYDNFSLDPRAKNTFSLQRNNINKLPQKLDLKHKTQKTSLES